MRAIWRCQGYRQGNGKFNGFVRWRDEDAAMYRDRSDIKVFELAEWNDKMSEWCDRIFASGVTHLVMCGHSYGVGRGCRALLKQIQKRNKEERKRWKKLGKSNGMPKPREVVVVALVSNDGVDRGGVLPAMENWLVHLLQFRSITKAALINLPKNSVRNLFGYRQSNRIPKGHKIKMGKQMFEPEIKNVDLDGWKLVHHDANPGRKERDFDESLVCRELELEVFKKFIG